MSVVVWTCHSVPCTTEDCKLVVTCKMQNRNATDKLNPQCSTLALFANTITEICGRLTMLVYYIVNLAYQLHFYFASDNQLAILCTLRVMILVAITLAQKN